MGDSKSVTGESWITQLSSSLQVATNGASAQGYGNGGWTVAQTASSATSIVNSLSAGTNVILLNLGVNDVGFVAPYALPDQTWWQNNYLAIIDAVRVRFPSASIYLMRPWKQGTDTEMDSLATWIGNVQAARAGVFLGPDERSWLKGADNGATMTSDGVHYSAAGQTECAAQWKQILGY
jgi:lysophospholipase L1-like esterase